MKKLILGIALAATVLCGTTANAQTSVRQTSADPTGIACTVGVSPILILRTDGIAYFCNSIGNVYAAAATGGGGGGGDITAVGTCLTGSCFQSETFATVFAGPSGNGVAAFRALLNTDIPQTTAYNWTGIHSFGAVETFFGIDGTVAGKITLYDTGGVSNHAFITTNVGGDAIITTHSTDGELNLRGAQLGTIGAISFENDAGTPLGRVNTSVLDPEFGDWIFDGTTLYVDADLDRVGIGTITPSAALQVVGTVAGTTVTGANVTTGADPGHTHTGASISGVDISADTNLAAGVGITLTGDTLDVDAFVGDVTGLPTATVVGDDSHAHTTTTISGLDISADTNLAAGDGLTLTGDQVTVQDCAANEILKRDKGDNLWHCAARDATNTPAVVTGPQFRSGIVTDITGTVTNLGSTSFGRDASGIIWHPVDSKYYIAQNGSVGGGKLQSMNLDGTSHIETATFNCGTGTDPDDYEGVTVVDFNDGFIYILKEGDGQPTTDPANICRITTSSITSGGTPTNDFTWLLNTSPNGTEGLAFVPHPDANPDSIGPGYFYVTNGTNGDIERFELYLTCQGGTNNNTPCANGTACTGGGTCTESVVEVTGITKPAACNGSIDGSGLYWDFNSKLLYWLWDIPDQVCVVDMDGRMIRTLDEVDDVDNEGITLSPSDTITFAEDVILTVAAKRYAVDFPRALDYGDTEGPPLLFEDTGVPAWACKTGSTLARRNGGANTSFYLCNNGVWAAVATGVVDTTCTTGDAACTFDDDTIQLLDGVAPTVSGEIEYDDALGRLQVGNGIGTLDFFPNAHTDVVDDATPQLAADLDSQGNNIDELGVLNLIEQADADADVAGRGQIWVNTAIPNQLFFTNDAGTDVQLGVGGGGTHPIAAGDYVAGSIDVFDTDQTTPLSTTTIDWNNGAVWFGDDLGSGGLIFEGDLGGVGNDNETFFSAIEPTTDRSIFLPDSDGKVALTNAISGVPDSLACTDCVDFSEIDLSLTHLTNSLGANEVYFSNDSAVEGGGTLRGGVIFEGSGVDAQEMFLTIRPLTAERTIFLPDAGGELVTTQGTTWIGNNIFQFANPKMTIDDTADATRTLEFTQNRIQQIDTGASELTFEAKAGANQAAAIGFFRTTNTTGAVRFIIYEGLNTANQAARIGVKANDTFFGLNPGDNEVGIGTNTPDVALEIVDTTTQFKIGHTQNTIETTFTVEADGDLNITTLPATGLVKIGSVGNPVAQLSGTPTDNQLVRFHVTGGGTGWVQSGTNAPTYDDTGILSVNAKVMSVNSLGIEAAGVSKILTLKSSGNMVFDIGGTNGTFNKIMNLNSTFPQFRVKDDVSLKTMDVGVSGTGALFKSGSGMLNVIWRDVNADDSILVHLTDGTVTIGEGNETATTTTYSLMVDPVAVQTILGGDIIAADMCGGIKLIGSAGTVATSLVNTFDDPADKNNGCIMNVCNTTATAITLDENSKFHIEASLTDIVLNQFDCVEVGSNDLGGYWIQLGQVQDNN